MSSNETSADYYYDDNIVLQTQNFTVEDDTTSGALTDTQEIVLSSISIVSGILSVVGSTLIILMVLDSPRKSPYKRILLGLSVTDVIASATFAITPFLLPAETSHRVWASGNDNTCSLLGFLYQFSFCPIWYNGMLSYYYLITIRYGVSQTVFARKYEPWVHALSLGFCLITAATGWGLGLYSEFVLSQGCWIAEYPEGCNETNTCIGNIIAWLFNGIPSLFFFLSIIINNVVILRFVKRTTQKVARFGGQGNNRNRQQDKKVSAVARQCCFYVTAFMLSYGWMMVLRICASVNLTDESKLYPLLVLQSIFHPLQGFTNCCVYSRPNYLRNRQQYPQKGRWWALKRVWFEKRSPRVMMRPPGRGSSWLPTSRSGTTEWFAGRSSHVSSQLSSAFGFAAKRMSRSNTAIPSGAIQQGPMDDYSAAPSNGRVVDPDQMGNEADCTSDPFDSRNPSLNPQSSGDSLELSTDASLSRGFMSPLGTISEEGEDTESGGEKTMECTRQPEEPSMEFSLVEGPIITRKVSQQNHKKHSKLRSSETFGRTLSVENLEQLTQSGSGKHELVLPEETLAEKLHRSFGGLLGVEDYKTSLDKNELKDVQDLVRGLNQNLSTANQVEEGLNSESGSEY